MSQILNKLREVDQNNSDAVKDVINLFIQTLPRRPPSEHRLWLESLLSTVNRFPRYCSSQRTAIENFILPFLDCETYSIVVEAAKCAHALQQVKPSNEKAVNAKSCWREQMSILCEAAHSLIGTIFPDSVDVYRDNGKSQNIQLQSLENSILAKGLLKIHQLNNVSKQEKLSVFCRRLINILIFIQAMLVDIYPVAKPVRPLIILDVVVRTLSVSSDKKQTNKLSIPNIARLKIQALRTLDSLVASLGSNLLPFSPLVFRLIMQTLKWSSENRDNETVKVRCATYKSLVNWLTVLHSHRISDSERMRWDHQLTSHIIGDVTPVRHVLELSVGNPPMKNLSKKAKRKLTNKMLQDSSIATHASSEKNTVNMSEENTDELTLTALECAETFLTVCGVFLKPAIHKQFQDLLVRECFNSSVYSQKRCLYLLRALEASRRAANRVPPPTQYCLKLYSSFVNSSNLQISQFCSQALQNIRMHLHCSPPSLNYALDVPSDVKDTNKKISEKNKAALQALLGANRLQEITDEHNINGEDDEPSSKKQRLEDDDVAEKISISSDSASSVEICDDSDKENDTVDAVVESEDVDEEIIEPLIIDSKTEQTTQPPFIKTQNIFDAKTQMPINESNDTVDADEMPSSTEVGYDCANSKKETVVILEKMEDEQLPCTNETDDVQITCGQVIKNSQELSMDKGKVEDAQRDLYPKLNGVNKSPDTTKVNGIDEQFSENNVIAKNVTSNDEVNVEEMLADFVDEVNEENNVEA